MNVKICHENPLVLISAYIPRLILDEAESLCKVRGLSVNHINEIRLRGIGPSSIVIDGKNILLSHRVTSEELHSILKRTCDRAIFAHRDDISNGFVSLEGGCRVGVCGRAKYDGGRLVGIGDVSALVFRIPSGRCDFADKLFSFWKTREFCGMLICSRAGIGKTTAIRALASIAGSPRYAKRVVVVDERCEFDPYAYRNCTVDILRGYSRARGIEIAVRTMSAEILVVDEIGNDADSDALMLAAGAGIPVIATVHGDDIWAISSKPSINKLFESSMFGLYSVITESNGKRGIKVGEVLRNADGGLCFNLLE